MIRSGAAAKLPGTKIQNRCAVTSVGLDAVDGLMGGGLPVHNLYVLSETSGQKFGTYFMRYYVAEGLNHSQKVVIVGLTEPEFLNEIPSCSSTITSVPNEPILNEDMSIAWRYSTMPSMNSGISSRDKNKYDLITKMDISNADLRLVLADSYKKLFEELVLLLQTDDYASETGNKMLRIVINDFGSPLFEDTDATYNLISKLKVVLLHSNAVCMLYLNEKLFSTSEIDRFIAVADTFFRVEPHDEEIKKDLGLEDNYDGRFHIVKLPLLNSFATNKPTCVDLVFERHRHYLEIKILHLPAVIGGALPVKSACQTVADSF